MCSSAGSNRLGLDCTPSTVIAQGFFISHCLTGPTLDDPSSEAGTDRRLFFVGSSLLRGGLYSRDYRYGKQRAWGALGYGASSLIGGVVYDAGTGGYAGVMVVFVVATVVAFGVATGVRIGTHDEVADDQKSSGQRCVFAPCLWLYRDGCLRCLNCGSSDI